MKLALVIAVALTFVCSCATSTTSSQPTDPEQVKGELTALERRLIVAVQRKDLATLNEIWADEYFGTAPTGVTVTKKDLMAAVVLKERAGKRSTGSPFRKKLSLRADNSSRNPDTCRAFLNNSGELTNAWLTKHGNSRFFCAVESP